MRRKLKIQTLKRNDICEAAEVDFKTLARLDRAYRQQLALGEKDCFAILYYVGRIGFELRQLGYDPTSIYFLPNCQWEELSFINPNLNLKDFCLACVRAYLYLRKKEIPQFNIHPGIADFFNKLTQSQTPPLQELQKYYLHLWLYFWSFSTNGYAFLGNLKELIPFFKNTLALKSKDLVEFKTLFVRYLRNQSPADLLHSSNTEEVFEKFVKFSPKKDSLKIDISSIKTFRTTNVPLLLPIEVDIPYLALPFALSDQGKESLKVCITNLAKKKTTFALNFQSTTLSLNLNGLRESVEHLDVRKTTSQFRDLFTQFYVETLKSFATVLKDYLIEQQFIIQGIELSKETKQILISSLEETTASCDVRAIKSIFRLLRDNASEVQTASFLTSDDERIRLKGLMLKQLLDDKEGEDCEKDH